MQNIFVYGTLKRGHQRGAALADQTFLSEAVTTPDYWMFDLGSYPGLVEADAGSADCVSGEVFGVDSKCRRLLDQIECVESGLYELREVRLEEVTVPNAIVEPVYAYFYLGSVAGCRRLQCWR